MTEECDQPYGGPDRTAAALPTRAPTTGRHRAPEPESEVEESHLTAILARLNDGTGYR